MTNETNEIEDILQTPEDRPKRTMEYVTLEDDTHIMAFVGAKTFETKFVDEKTGKKKKKYRHTYRSYEEPKGFATDTLSPFLSDGSNGGKRSPMYDRLVSITGGKYKGTNKQVAIQATKNAMWKWYLVTTQRSKPDAQGRVFVNVLNATPLPPALAQSMPDAKEYFEKWDKAAEGNGHATESAGVDALNNELNF